jgi:hypothetical protein
MKLTDRNLSRHHKLKVMDFSIPAQLLEIGNIHLKPFHKKGHYPPLAALQYTSPTITLKHFSILTPTLRIEEWNSVRGRLRLNCDDHAFFKAKFIAMQEYLISTLLVHQQMLLGRSDMTRDSIEVSFKLLFDKGCLNCFNSLYHLFPLYEAGRRVPPEKFGETLRTGRHIRLILQLTGISHLVGEGGRSSFRIQHQILGAYLTG